MGSFLEEAIAAGWLPLPSIAPARRGNGRREDGSTALRVAVAGSSGSSNCLYISGVPGTGKTATCLEVVRRLQRRAQVGEIASFRFVEINGLRLPTPHHAYSRLFEALTGQQLPPPRAAEMLESHFSKGSTKVGQADTAMNKLELRA